MGKVNTKASRAKKHRHDPLLQDIDSAQGSLRTVKHNKKAALQKDDAGEEEGYLDSRSSRKILQLAKEQQDEIAEEEDRLNQETAPRFSHPAGFNYSEEEDQDDDSASANGKFSDFEPDSEDSEGRAQKLVEEEEELVEIDEEDAAMFEQYFKRAVDYNSASGSYNLADKIMATIREKEAELKRDSMDLEGEGRTGETNVGQRRPSDGVALPEKVIRAYTTVGTILKTWTHGKLPKLFKVIPSLRNWQDVLYVTNPEEWSPNAVYEATKLFISNLPAKEAQKFINSVLLPRFCDNIETSDDHTLNYHIYRALKKALYKPSAFFKGFLFPLVEGGCNVREATIAGSVLAKVSVPALHSSAALSFLLQLPFSPAATVFIKVLLDKRYALPYQTVDECVYYFMRFRMLDDGSNGEEASITLPLVWHKAFLTFAQRYKNDITEDQRDFLLETVRQRGHKDIGPEIRRELLAGKSREFVDPAATPKDELMIDVQ